MIKYFELNVEKILATHDVKIKKSGPNLYSLSWKHGVTVFALSDIKQARLAAAVYIHLWRDKEVSEALAAGCAEALVRDVPASVVLKDNRNEKYVHV